jgi:hypothetical protein
MKLVLQYPFVCSLPALCIAIDSQWHAECKMYSVKSGTLKTVELTNCEYLIASHEPDMVNFTIRWISNPVCFAVQSAFLLSPKPSLNNQLPSQA